MIRRSTKSLARRARRGTVLVQLALSLILLMTILAITVDLGFLLVERRHAQATADASALAAASDLYYNWGADGGSDPNNNALKSALGVASANGYTNDGTTSTVSVKISPAAYSGGPNAGKAVPPGYAEVTVTYNQGAYSAASSAPEPFPSVPGPSPKAWQRQARRHAGHPPSR